MSTNIPLIFTSPSIRPKQYALPSFIFILSPTKIKVFCFITFESTLPFGIYL